MAHFSQSLLSAFASPRRLVLFATLAAAAIPSTADARVGAYDGVWNVTFATTRGNCSSGYSVPFSVTGNRVSSAASAVPFDGSARSRPAGFARPRRPMGQLGILAAFIDIGLVNTQVTMASTVQP